MNLLNLIHQCVKVNGMDIELLKQIIVISMPLEISEKFRDRRIRDISMSDILSEIGITNGVNLPDVEVIKGVSDSLSILSDREDLFLTKESSVDLLQIVAENIDSGDYSGVYLKSYSMRPEATLQDCLDNISRLLNKDTTLISLFQFLNEMKVAYQGDTINLYISYKEHVDVLGDKINFSDKTDSKLSICSKLNEYVLDVLFQMNEFLLYDLFKSISEELDGKKLLCCISDDKKRKYQRYIRAYNGFLLISNGVSTGFDFNMTKLLYLCAYGGSRRWYFLNKVKEAMLND